MPVIWKRNHSEYSILIWKSIESIEQLIVGARLTENEFNELKSFKSETRKREWLTVRNAIREMNVNDEQISYDKNGKPYLQSKKISISHSHEMIAVMTSDSDKIGIDIEIIHPRIEVLSRKFLSEEEKINVPEKNRIETLNVFWGAKEVLYKIHSIGNINFKKDFFVRPFMYSSPGELKASILKTGYEKEYEISYEKTGDYMLTFCHS